MADGEKTYQEAVQNAEIIIQQMGIETAQELGLLLGFCVIEFLLMES
jgi:predicted RNase H-like HicB family nuclease